MSNAVKRISSPLSRALAAMFADGAGAGPGAEAGTARVSPEDAAQAARRGESQGPAVLRAETNPGARKGRAGKLTGISILDTGSLPQRTPSRHPLILRLAVFPPGTVFAPARRSWHPDVRNPEPGNFVLQAHSINTSPTLTSWPPDFAASTPSRYPVATGKERVFDGVDAV